MDRQSLVDGLKRLSSVNPTASARMERGEQQTYVVEIERAVGFLTNSEWRSVVDVLIETRTGRTMPTIPEIRKGIGIARGRGEIKPPKTCESCGGAAMVHVVLRRLVDGEAADATKPCPACQSSRVFEAPFGWREETSPPRHALRMAWQATPIVAKRILAQAEAEGVKFDEDVMLALLQRAGEDLKPKGPVIRPLGEALDDAMRYTRPAPVAPPAGGEVDRKRCAAGEGGGA